MIIQVKKFGTTLISRPAGKEAYLAFQPSLKDISEREKVVVDFEGVEVLTPSWADEFLSPLIKRYNDKMSFRNVGNSSVIESLKILNLYTHKEN
jgi:hypothetical protein